MEVVFNKISATTSIYVGACRAAILIWFCKDIQILIFVLALN